MSFGDLRAIPWALTKEEEQGFSTRFNLTPLKNCCKSQKALSNSSSKTQDPRENRKSRRKFIFLPKPPVGSHEGCRQEERSGPSPVIGRLGD